MSIEPICLHIKSLKDFKFPRAHVCEECLKTGDDWVHLRTCQTCGITLCCDDSINTHMTKHFYTTGHPVVISAEAGENWIWCYKDEVFAEY